MSSTPDLSRPARAPRVAEAALRGAHAARRVVRAVRRDQRGVQQRRAPARAGLFQPGEPERLSPRQHPRRAAGARLHAVARASRRARPQRRRRLRARVEQERAGDAAPHARHRLPAVDHVQRSRARCARTRRRSAGPRSSSRTRAAAARAFRWSTRWRRWRRSFHAIPACGCPTICSCSRNICRTIPSAASSASSFSAASCSTRCASSRTGGSTCAPRRCATPTMAPARASCRMKPAAMRCAAGRVLPVPRGPRDAVDTAQRIVQRRETRRRRHRIPRDHRRPARVLRHQRQLQPAPVRSGRLRLRSVRARRRLPGRHPRKTIGRARGQSPFPRKGTVPFRQAT